MADLYISPASKPAISVHTFGGTIQLSCATGLAATVTQTSVFGCCSRLLCFLVLTVLSSVGCTRHSLPVSGAEEIRQLDQ